MKTLISTITVVTILLCTSCSTVDIAEDPLQGITERTDIIIDGDISLEDFRQVNGDGLQNDLVSYRYYGAQSGYFDFIIQLVSGEVLTIQLYDALRPDPWENVNVSYNTYPGQDLEDKLFYTNITLSDKHGTHAYSTNSDLSIPPGISLNVFRITRFSGNEIHCKIRDMILYQTNHPTRTITINGTFNGAFEIAAE